jgi:hypothetical protein
MGRTHLVQWGYLQPSAAVQANSSSPPHLAALLSLYQQQRRVLVPLTVQANKLMQSAQQ